MNRKQRAKFFMEHQEKFWNENKDKDKTELYLGWKEASLAIERVRELARRMNCSHHYSGQWVTEAIVDALDGEK